ncbi:hypothetical protein BH11PSE8_BH11PSE8_15430 [soil metagenome]
MSDSPAHPPPVRPPEDEELALSFAATHATLRLAVELGNIALWRQNLATDRLYFNDRGYAMVGIASKPDGISLEETLAYIHPDDLPRVRAAAHQALTTEQPTDIEARYRRADGSWRRILTRRVVEHGPNGAPVAIVGVALDVTEREEAQMALRDVSERSALIARHAGIGTWEYDVRSEVASDPAGATAGVASAAVTTPVFERWDEQMFRLRGMEPRALPPNRDERLAMTHPDDRHRLLDTRPDEGRTDLTLSYDFRIRMPDGSYRWLASRSATLRNDEGAIVRRVGVNWDVTERKNAELAQQQKALAERESQAKSQFLSRMSHELRTPLNAVLGFTQLLQLEAAGTSDELRSDDKLARIRQAGEHLLALIDDVLDLSSLEAGQLPLDLRAIDLALLAEQTLPMVESLAAQHGVQLVVVPPRDKLPSLALADMTRTRQVLVNLLTNAIKYNRPNGIVQVEYFTESERARLRVRDTGRGLTSEQLAHLFEPFNRLGIESGGIAGTGIGLTIVKALVQGMGGTIGVASVPGEGTVFDVSLPSVAAIGEPGARDGDETRPGSSAAGTPPETASRTPPPTIARSAQPTTHASMNPQAAPRLARSGQLLYIEDNKVNVLLVEELVKSLGGLRLESEGSGQEGVARARTLRPDLILVDMQLPDFDGFEVLRRLRTQPETASTVCVALSANAMPEDIERGLAAGFDDYWTKPIVFKTFLAALDRMFPLR